MNGNAAPMPANMISKDLTGDQIHGRGSGAPVWHVDDIHAGRGLEQLARQMWGAAGARRRIAQLSRLRFRERDQLSYRFHGQRWMHDQDIIGPDVTRIIGEKIRAADRMAASGKGSD